MTSDRHNHSDTKQANCQIKYRLVHMFDLQPPRHISTLRSADLERIPPQRRLRAERGRSFGPQEPAGVDPHRSFTSARSNAGPCPEADIRSVRRGKRGQERRPGGWRFKSLGEGQHVDAPRTEPSILFLPAFHAIRDYCRTMFSLNGLRQIVNSKHCRSLDP